MSAWLFWLPALPPPPYSWARTAVTLRAGASAEGGDDGAGEVGKGKPVTDGAEQQPGAEGEKKEEEEEINANTVVLRPPVFGKSRSASCCYSMVTGMFILGVCQVHGASRELRFARLWAPACLLSSYGASDRDKMTLETFSLIFNL